VADQPYDRRSHLAHHLCDRWSGSIGPHVSTEGGCAMHRAVAGMVMEIDNLDAYLTRYILARGIEPPVYDTGSKIIEEALELQQAVRTRDFEAVKMEAADVAITALVAARQFGTTLEEALEAKIAEDTGRGPKK
jgi:phosphoribosyl-ATP pyrophosphohydrolase